MKGILFIDFLIQKDFLNTRSRQWSFLLTNQNAHLITYEPMKFRVTKVKSKFKSSASKRASCKWKRYQLWILLNLWQKYLKLIENRGNVQKIYDSLKELQDECHCTSSLLKVTWTCPIWQSEKMVENLNRSSCLCEVLLVWNHSTSSQGWVHCSKVEGHLIHHSGELSGTFF